MFTEFIYAIIYFTCSYVFLSYVKILQDDNADFIAKLFILFIISLLISHFFGYTFFII